MMFPDIIVDAASRSLQLKSGYYSIGGMLTLVDLMSPRFARLVSALPASRRNNFFARSIESFTNSSLDTYVSISSKLILSPNSSFIASVFKLVFISRGSSPIARLLPLSGIAHSSKLNSESSSSSTCISGTTLSHENERFLRA